MKLICAITCSFFILACNTPKKVISTRTGQSQDLFWRSLNELCGKTYEGVVIVAPPNDTTFKNKKLIMHVRSCEANRIRIPFIVGENRSRTWVITRSAENLRLKHDHRHEDGKPDSVTMYGGMTSNSGSSTTQFFPADQQTVMIIPAAAGNIWWIDIMPGKYFSYNLRRMGTDRLFSIRFDITTPVARASAPWGWEE